MKLPWYIRQKITVALAPGLGGLFTVIAPACAQPWAACVPPINGLMAISGSADGARLVGISWPVQYGGYSPSPVYASTNAGVTWMETASPQLAWTAIASSADGAKLVAAPWGDRIYVSTNSGTTWVASGSLSNNWACIASSADGTRLVAGVGGMQLGGDHVGAYVGPLYTSGDAGLTWQPAALPSGTWSCLSSSADGTKLAAATHYYSTKLGSFIAGPMYASLDGGVTWRQSTAPSNNWVSVALSADGTTMVAATSEDATNTASGLIYISTNSGASWRPTAAPRNDWFSVAASADGTQLVAGPASGQAIVSADSGSSWRPTSSPWSSWSSIVSSADGYRVVAVSDGVCALPYFGPWRVTATPSEFSSLASSADGRSLIATRTDLGFPSFPIYVSSDSGLHWTQTVAPSNYWAGVASSLDGGRLVAAGGVAGGPLDFYGDGRIYASADSGTTWATTTAPSNNWVSVTSSADGSKLYAAAANIKLGGGWYGVSGVAIRDPRIYKSLDSGASWAPTSAPSNDWACVASSADGTSLIAVPDLGSIYVSLDSGATWNATGPPNAPWSAVASSSQGTLLVAAGQSIYTSTNSGATWTQTAAPAYVGGNYQSLAASADGTVLVAKAPEWPPVYYLSTNSGAAWMRGDTPAGIEGGVAVSADGSHIFAGGNGLLAVLSSPAPAPPAPHSPRLQIGLSDASLELSWLVPSTSFVLQQSSNLTSPNWSDVTNQPALNLTNLHSELTLLIQKGTAFYRLKQP